MDTHCTNLSRTVVLAAICAFAAIVANGVALAAPHFRVLHQFKDGHPPDFGGSGLLAGPGGELYGVTYDGGRYSGGTVFQLVPNADRSKWTFNLLHEFCRHKNQLSCTDGQLPNDGLIMDADGALYGTTIIGGRGNPGNGGDGVLYRLAPDQGSWDFSILHHFCRGACKEGSQPTAGLTYAGQSSGAPWDGSSPLYGTSTYGGKNVEGTVYEVTPGTKWNVHSIYDFAGTSFAFLPGVAMNSAGDLFGVKSADGKNGAGVMFKLAHGSWKSTILHDFCNAICDEGAAPNGSLLVDAADNIYGTTFYDGPNNKGTVFQFTAAGKMKVLYAFCPSAPCTDGANPASGLTMDVAGNLYGTTLRGGNTTASDCSRDGGCGVVFALTPNEKDHWRQRVLHTFCGDGDCEDGRFPITNVVFDATGALVGTPPSGGKFSAGTLFQLKP